MLDGGVIVSKVPTRWRLASASLTALLLYSLITVGAVVARPPTAGEKPDRITTASDAAKYRLHPRLLAAVESGSTASLWVFLTTAGDPSAALDVMDSGYIADGGDAAIVVGRIRAYHLVKLASVPGVISVGPIDFKQSGKPLGVPDPEVEARPSTDVLSKTLHDLYKKEVPYSAAPPLAGSNFDDLKDLAVLDARTHSFAEAWDAGYTGTGVTVAVLDGGTDFGHPDLIGTWQTWSGLTGSRAGWNGWPKAFDPFGALQWLAAPSQIDQGLSWYVKTTAVTCKDWATKGPKAICSIKFSTKTGPSRNFSAPSGTNQHSYLFPAGVS